MRHLSEFEGELRQLMEDDKGLVSTREYTATECP